MFFDFEISDNEKKKITDELCVLESKGVDLDQKLKINPKSEMKEKLGRSPDDLDNFIMRMYFETTKKPSSGTVNIWR